MAALIVSFLALAQYLAHILSVANFR